VTGGTGSIGNAAHHKTKPARTSTTISLRVVPIRLAPHHSSPKTAQKQAQPEQRDSFVSIGAASSIAVNHLVATTTKTPLAAYRG